MKLNLASYNERGATALLLLLICTDLAFVVLHVVNHALPEHLRNPLLRIDKDRTYPELYQYVKYLWIVLLLMYLTVKQRAVQYWAWILLFAYFLSDDSLRIHEQVGRHISRSFNFTPPLGLKPNDFGELLVSATSGLVLFPCLIWAYWSGSAEFRKVSQDIVLLVLFLVFFGVVVDTVHMIIHLGWLVSFAFGIIEDGGEMMSLSLIVWYLFFLMLRNDRESYYLCDLLRNAIIR